MLQTFSDCFVQLSAAWRRASNAAGVTVIQLCASVCSNCNSWIAMHRMENTKFPKNAIEYKMCVLIFSILYVWNVSHSKKNWTRYYHTYTGCSCKVLSHFIDTWIFSTDFRKTQNQIARKSVQWEPSCSLLKDGQTDWQTGWQADGRKDRLINIETDMTKLIFVVCNFAKGSKKKVMVCCSQQTMYKPYCINRTV
jgi:hypothetical protein